MKEDFGIIVVKEIESEIDKFFQILGDLVLVNLPFFSLL
jgi:hypothetical protein